MDHSKHGPRTAKTLVVLLVVVAAACQSSPQASSSARGSSAPGATTSAVRTPTVGTPTPVPSSVATTMTGPLPFADVPMYRMDPTHQGVQPGPGPEGQPRLMWSAKAGGALSSPIIGDGTLFVGGDDGHLYAFDPLTGADRWRLDIGAPSNVPVFGDGVVAVADGNGVLHGITAATGIERWHTPPVVNLTAPVLAGSIVYITGTDHKAHGFDLQTGAERWSWTSTADLSNALVIGTDAAYVSSHDGVLHAVTLDGSHELWSYQMDSTEMGSPTISGDVVLINSLQGAGAPSGELYALDRTSGQLLWRFRGPTGLQISLGPVRDGILYAPTEADGIYALRVADGSLVWHVDGPRAFFPTTLVDDTLYLTAESPPEMAAFRASDGSPLWALPTTDIPKGNPVVSGGMLFGADISGVIRAYGSATTAAGPTPTARPLTSPSATPGLPNPFTVVGRWDPSNLALDRPLALAIGPNGDAYVTESNDRVTQISPDGTVIRRWGKEGTKAGEFDFVGPNVQDGASASIAVGPDGNVYVSDSDNHRVQVFSADGTFVRQFGSFGNGDGQFALPFDLSVDTAGNVYVLDDILLRISKFGPDGAFLWTADGSTAVELKGHGHNADIDSQGRIVVGNDDTGQIVYLDPDGKVVDAFDAETCNVTVDAADDLYSGGCGSDRIDVFDPAHQLIGSWSGPDMSLVAPPEFGPNGEILALDRDGGIVKLTLTLPPSTPSPSASPVASSATTQLTGDWDTGPYASSDYGGKTFEFDLRFYAENGVPFVTMTGWDPTKTGMPADGDHGPFELLPGNQLAIASADQPEIRTLYSYQLVGDDLTVTWVRNDPNAPPGDVGGPFTTIHLTRR